MIMIDQLPLEEMGVNGDLDIVTINPLLKQIEKFLKYSIFQQTYFPVDKVAETVVEIPVPIHGCTYRDLGIERDVQFDDSKSHIKARHYSDVLTPAKNSWAFGMSQIFSSVSPEMHEEFEVPYLSRLYARFGNGYYGCCEPLHDKVDMVRKYPNIRKISMSPWANKRKGAEAIHGDYVYSTKPSPAFLARTSFDEDAVRADLIDIIDACRSNNTNCELILKDVSTTMHCPERVFRWAKIATDLVHNY